MTCGCLPQPVNSEEQRKTLRIALICNATMFVVAMLLLAWGKNVTGKLLDNPVLIAESRVTVIDAYLAAAVLVGVALNALFGW